MEVDDAEQAIPRGADHCHHGARSAHESASTLSIACATRRSVKYVPVKSVFGVQSILSLGCRIR